MNIPTMRKRRYPDGRGSGQCSGRNYCPVRWLFVLYLSPAANRGQTIGPATGDEAELLDYALGRSDRSRLACQIRLTEAMDGLVVEVPAQQR